MKDDIWYVRMHAVRSLNKLSKAKGIAETASLVNDDALLVRESARHAMAEHIETALPYIEKKIYQRINEL